LTEAIRGRHQARLREWACAGRDSPRNPDRTLGARPPSRASLTAPRPIDRGRRKLTSSDSGRVGLASVVDPIPCTVCLAGLSRCGLQRVGCLSLRRNRRPRPAHHRFPTLHQNGQPSGRTPQRPARLTSLRQLPQAILPTPDPPRRDADIIRRPPRNRLHAKAIVDSFRGRAEWARRPRSFPRPLGLTPFEETNCSGFVLLA
jgi:hypothetical protein